ncbi:signal recognition particle receptor protein FtsY, alpha subunit [Pseudonocardia sp. Ae406_Ps2]|uniref:signal recognition particle-docking protein FtsY n=1 Tax=unclassified Pseudonocardia TaxID=2619320 RepID=UPI00094B4863|nr:MULTISPECIES: signal recognition particle-docking protein FtsY [unclassified Pseudonocardia]OLM02177.1 signal recognition particle receptor protein FtsY, alpha subunit [Pseudonocardia sp. Ae406_Ps2]OLM06040.1 signal recognition particle receptor protein FtsY, alpha subunit [Pseudonocardia sp. Ae331_Ps2]OLM15308.1 signal recognition particle receptor protein FtsY, alpha subunit [Pseudonocardia sp. Ae505_Ps2]OLM23749.1 signal recognition particle receptor protein FtsY, alpha subunit [Pseudonoc
MTTQTLWIVVAIVVAVLLIAVVAGLVIARRRRISLRSDEQQRELGTGTDEPPRAGGGYQAGSGFAFSSGTATAPERPRAPGDDAPTAATPTATPSAPASPADAAADAPTAATPTTTPSAPEAPAEAADAPTADEVRTPPGGTPVVDGATEARTPPRGVPVSTAPPVPSTAPPSSPPVPTEQTGTVTGTPDARVIDTAEASKDPATRQLRRPEGPAGTAGTDAPAASAPTQPVARPEAAPPPAAPTAPTVPSALTEPSAPTEPVARPGTPDTQAPGTPTEEIAPAEGRIGRLRGRLSRSRSGLGQSLLGLLGAGDLDEESWEDVEATLLQADLGPETTAEIVDALREQIATRGVRTAEQARAALRDVLVEALGTGQDRSVHALPHDGRPAVLLIVGVNGTGKTTTTGKLARVLVAGGHRVTLGAADTFRAAAAEQLVTWGERSGAGVVRGPEGADPASVAFDAVTRGTDDGVDAVLLDTAGRLHTKTGLMDELGKVKRVVEKQARVDEVLLVLDATTGQNGLTQARVFGEVVDVTGVVLTKLDGTAKGGIVFRVQRELGVPVKLVGLGEGPDDLAPFEPAAFVEALLD